jgi:hypothetical protein
MNPESKLEVIKGSPIWIVAAFQTVTDSLPSLILWVTFIYGILQIIRISKDLLNERKQKNESIDNARDNQNRGKSNRPIYPERNGKR